MNNEHCWYNLNLDVSNAIRPGFDMGDQTWTVKRIMNISDMFTADWLEYMSDLGMPITATMMFQRQVNTVQSSAHVDVMISDKQTPESLLKQTPICRNFAINWVIGGRDSEMKWYNLPGIPNDGSTVQFNLANTPYMNWPITELTEIDRCCIQSQPTMVRVDMPHAIEVKDEPRIAISVRTNGLPNDWQIAINYLRDKQLLIER
jgi:hypothetical protein